MNETPSPRDERRDEIRGQVDELLDIRVESFCAGCLVLLMGFPVLILLWHFGRISSALMAGVLGASVVVLLLLNRATVMLARKRADKAFDRQFPADTAARDEANVYLWELRKKPSAKRLLLRQGLPVTGPPPSGATEEEATGESEEQEEEETFDAQEEESGEVAPPAPVDKEADARVLERFAPLLGELDAVTTKRVLATTLVGFGIGVAVTAVLWIVGVLPVLAIVLGMFAGISAGLVKNGLRNRATHARTIERLEGYIPSTDADFRRAHALLDAKEELVAHQCPFSNHPQLQAGDPEAVRVERELQQILLSVPSTRSQTGCAMPVLLLIAGVLLDVLYGWNGDALLIAWLAAGVFLSRSLAFPQRSLKALRTEFEQRFSRLGHTRELVEEILLTMPESASPLRRAADLPFRCPRLFGKDPDPSARPDASLRLHDPQGRMVREELVELQYLANRINSRQIAMMAFIPFLMGIPYFLLTRRAEMGWFWALATVTGPALILMWACIRFDPLSSRMREEFDRRFPPGSSARQLALAWLPFCELDGLKHLELDRPA